jgi:hypothetical protein
MNIFISFYWDDRDQVNGFRSMLANPDIKRQITRKITHSDIIIC